VKAARQFRQLGGFSVKTKLGGILFGLLFLAACSGGASYNPSSPSATGSAPDVSHAKGGPTFEISTQLPDAAHPKAISASLASLVATTYVKKKKYKDVVSASLPCTMGISGGTMTGCEILTAGSVGFTITKGTFNLYSKAKGKGCLLAIGHYKGALVPGYAVPIVFKVENAKKCWQS
jgi:hypothetical protein